jgi:hypothetical protein
MREMPGAAPGTAHAPMTKARRRGRLRPLMLLAFLALFCMVAPAQAQLDPTGTYGFRCFPGGTCAGGACNTRGFCAQCGGAGQLACQNAPLCAEEYRGFQAIPAGNGQLYCGIRTPLAFAPGYCGSAGFPACNGVECLGASYLDGVSRMCLACGSIEQRCCGPNRLCDWGNRCVGGWCTDPALGPPPPEPLPPATVFPTPSTPPFPDDTPPAEALPGAAAPPQDINRCFSRDGRHDLCRRNNCNIPERRERVCQSRDGRHQLCQQNNCSPSFINTQGQPYQVPCYWEERVAPGVPCYWQ